MNPPDKQHPLFITALMRPAAYDHPVESIELLETHISWVILTGPYAYKIKKPVDLGFLDFSTLEKRHFYCHEELRLNRRLAQDIYLEVVPITGTAEQAYINGEGEAIDYAVKMRQFPQQAQLDRMLERQELQASHIDAFARLVADFHQQVSIAGPDTAFGDPAQVCQPVAENFAQIRERISEEKTLLPLAELENWAEATFTTLQPVFAQRKAQGYIRECHGDMHLRNLAWINNAPVAFDCIEFNPDLRWIDVLSEVAFLVMDLQDRGQAGFAQRFLNAYLEVTGDYGGMRVLAYYLCYRALVRAKVDAIRASQPGISQAEQAEAEEDLYGYLQLAQNYCRSRQAHLIITRGMSASGKSTLTQPLLEQLGAIRLRSDVERKRLFGLKAEEDAAAATGEGIYTDEASQRTYDRLVELASMLIDAGYPVIVDAACLKHDQREKFRLLAAEKQVPYTILEFTASPGTLRRRIVERQPDASDADLAVLEHQLATWQPLRESEESQAIRIDTEATFDVLQLVEQITTQPTN